MQENRLFEVAPVHPGEHLRQILDEKGWTQDQLAQITGYSRSQINEVVTGKSNVTPEIAIALGAALGTTAQYWMQVDSSFRLSQANHDTSAVQKNIRVYEVAPVRDMQRRGWIRDTKSITEIESDLKSFFQVDSLEQDPDIDASTRKSDSGEPLSPSQRAWCFRVRQLGRAQLVAQYSEARLDECTKALRRIAAYPQETYKVPEVLCNFGIRLVVVEALRSSKVDGVALWLNETSPVIGMSLLHDRNDSFWFTLFHELSHIRHRDAAPLDSNLTDHGDIDSTMIVKSQIEQRANLESAEALVPKAEIESFIRRAGPMYSKQRINQFAQRIKIHPGIIVGQLQRRREIGYSANREMLSKIRQIVIPTAITDGWGISIDPRNSK